MTVIAKLKLLCTTPWYASATCADTPTSQQVNFKVSVLREECEPVWPSGKALGW